MADVFISYKRETDTQLYGNPISKFVNKLIIEFKLSTDIPLEVFIDKENVKLGVEWDKKIGKELIEADFLIVFFSTGYFNSDNCIKELNAFIDPKRGLEAKKKKYCQLK